MTSIYCLKHPTTGEVRYVGKTTYPLVHRLRAHLREARHPSCKHRRKCRWIMALARDDLVPVIEVLETVVPPHSWEDAERQWISFYRNMNGKRMLNHDDGGMKSRGSFVSAKTRRKISEANKRRKPMFGRPVRPETREKIRNALLGRKSTKKVFGHTEATREKMRAAAKHRPPISAETRRKLSEKKRGRKFSEETRNKLRANALARLQTPEGREQWERAKAARLALTSA